MRSLYKLSKIVMLVGFACSVRAQNNESCQSSLMGKTDLAIGVLTNGKDGNSYLAAAPYVGVGHGRLLDHLEIDYPTAEVLWMGEMRYRQSIINQILMIEANETSGHYVFMKSEKGRPEFMVDNRVENLPSSVRSPEFVGYKYDKCRQHLVGKIDGRTNTRHALNSALQVILTSYGLLFRLTDEEQIRMFIDRLAAEKSADLDAVSWLIDYMASLDKIKIQDFVELRDVVRQFHEKRWDEIIRRDEREKVKRQVLDLAQRFRNLSESPQILVWQIR